MVNLAFICPDRYASNRHRPVLPTRCWPESDEGLRNTFRSHDSDEDWEGWKHGQFYNARRKEVLKNFPLQVNVARVMESRAKSVKPALSDRFLGSWTNQKTWTNQS